MDPSVYEAAESGDVGFFRRARHGDVSILHQKTPAHKNIFHIAAEYKQIHFFRDVLFDDQSLPFWADNKKGNTPLHVAARIGCDEIVQFLIEHAKKLLHMERADEERGPNGEANKLLRITNLQGDTAFHVAAKYGHVGVVNLLMAADPGLCCLTNFKKESPLFLATRHGFPLVTRSILNDCPISPSFRGLIGVTALHVAVTCMDEESEGIVETMVSKYPDIIKRVEDQLGWTPLHYAALRGNLEATQLLMQRDSSVSYILDKSGMSALHVAAYAGHTDVMDEMIRCRPDICDLVNHYGQTALHAAVLGGRTNVIMHSLNMSKLAELINEADADGNTPLHLAAIKKNPEIIRALTGDPRVDMIATNRKFSQAYDICLSQNIGEQTLHIQFRPGEANKVVHASAQHALNLESSLHWLEDEIFGSSSRRVLDNFIGLPYFHRQIRRDFWNVPEKDTIDREKEKLLRREFRLLVATVVASITFPATFVGTGASGSDGNADFFGTNMFSTSNLISFVFSFLVIYNEIVDKNFLSTRQASHFSQLSAVGMVVTISATQTLKEDTKQSLREIVEITTNVMSVLLLFLLYAKFWEAVRMKLKQRQLYKRGFSFYVSYVSAYIRKKFQKQHAL